MMTEPEVVVRPAHDYPAAIDGDLAGVPHFVDHGVEGDRRGAKAGEAVRDVPQLVEQVHHARSRSATRAVTSVPAWYRARVSARRTLPLVVRGIVPGGVTTI